MITGSIKLFDMQITALSRTLTLGRLILTHRRMKGFSVSLTGNHAVALKLESGTFLMGQQFRDSIVLHPFIAMKEMMEESI